MKQHNLNYFLICATDEYLNEYIPLGENSRYLLSGFSGSTGDLLVGEDEAFLFVDGRYHKQADEQVNHELIKVVKLSLEMSQKQAIINILKQKNQNNLGIPSLKMRYLTFDSLKNDLPDTNFVEFDTEPVFQDFQKEENNSPSKKIGTEITGLSADEKFLKIREELEDKCLIITKLDEIAYLTNIRSSQIKHFSGFKAKALLLKEKCLIFSDIENFGIGNYFELLPEENFWDFLNTQKSLLAVKSSINLKIYRSIENKTVSFIKESPVSVMKSIKNRSEIAHMKRCFERTDKVMAGVSKWLQECSDCSEFDLSEKVRELFFKEGASDLSFSTIASFGNNSASIHYSTPSKEILLKDKDLILLDCGAYFEGGYATDITRVFFKGKNPDKEQKEIYTTVLRAFLNGLNYSVSAQTSGYDIDRKVRDITEQCSLKSFKFLHSTGHGVGISVHESPPYISPSEAAQALLKAGMCFTIEPGLYDSDKFGVRLENTVMLDDENGHLKITSFSKAPFEENLIEYSLLTDQEKIWLKEYQQQCKQ